MGNPWVSQCLSLPMTFLKVQGRRIFTYTYIYSLITIPMTYGGIKNPLISLVTRGKYLQIHRYSVPTWVMGKSSNGYKHRWQLIYQRPLKQAQKHKFW